MSKIATTPGQIYSCLKGLICLHKPSGMPVGTLLSDLNNRIMKDLNDSDPEYQHRMETNRTIQKQGGLLDYSSHPLVLGDTFGDQDVELQIVNAASDFSSGLVLVTVNDLPSTQILQDAILPKQYILSLILGRATNNSLSHGKVLEKSSFGHLKNRPQILEKTLAQVRSAHQRDAFKQAGVNMQSQEAYELAVKGLVKPTSEQEGYTIVYGLECVDFDLPHVKLKVTCINESPIYLAELCAELGLKLRTNAVLDRLHLLRYGPFSSENSLLLKHVNLQNILYNINDNQSNLDFLRARESAPSNIEF